MVRPFAAMLALAVWGAPVATHPLHTSFTEARRERGGAVHLSIRLFADDFGALLDSLGSGRTVSRDSVASRYVSSRVSLSSGSRPVPLRWCGMRTEGGLAWACLRSAAAVPEGRLHLRNALLFDRFEDQVSVVRWAGSRTLVLSARSPIAVLD